MTSEPAAVSESSTERSGSARLLGRIHETLRQNLESLADEMSTVGPDGTGWAVRSPAFPAVWGANQLHLTGPTSFDEAVSLAEAHQAGLGYRHIVIEDEASARQAADRFRADGWRMECDLWLALQEGPDREVDTSSVVPLSEKEMLSLMMRWLTEDYPDTDPDRLAQVGQWGRLVAASWNERPFGIVGSDGAPAATTKLRVQGTTAWVEDVYTVPEERGRGHARALVSHAVALARSGDHDLTFIIADDNDWPKQLYQKLGFRPIGRTFIFHREL
jgi:GNAT superfamily N-acetyltransferase